MAVKDYVNLKIGVTELHGQFDSLAGKLTDGGLINELKQVGVGKRTPYEQKRLENIEIENQINQLTDTSITASNDTIKSISPTTGGRECPG